MSAFVKRNICAQMSDYTLQYKMATKLNWLLVIVLMTYILLMS